MSKKYVKVHYDALKKLFFSGTYLKQPLAQKYNLRSRCAFEKVSLSCLPLIRFMRYLHATKPRRISFSPLLVQVQHAYCRKKKDLKSSVISKTIVLRFLSLPCQFNLSAILVSFFNLPPLAYLTRDANFTKPSIS